MHEDGGRRLLSRAGGHPFVESDDYLQFAERVEPAEDDSRYDVWVVWDAETFNRAVVRTKQLLGGTMRDSKEVVEQERAVARGVTAPEVVEWAVRYWEAGLAVRVVPEFRWRLGSSSPTSRRE